MKVCPIQAYKYTNYAKTNCLHKTDDITKNTNNETNPNFKGLCGKLMGGSAGYVGGLLLSTALLPLLPVAIPAAAGAGILGATLLGSTVAGAKLGDKIDD